MKIIERATFEAEGQTMRIALHQGTTGRWAVYVTVREAGKLISSGYAGVGPEAEVRKLWSWSLQQAEAKRWKRAVRGGRRLAVLPGIPEPGARGNAHPVAVAPVAKRGPRASASTGTTRTR